MAEVGISVATKVAEYLVQPIIRHGQYLFCANKFLKNLEDKKKELVSTQDIVLKRVEEARRKTERIEDVVLKWLTEVQTLLEEVEKLEQEVKEKKQLFPSSVSYLEKISSMQGNGGEDKGDDRV
ncbi:hypothetical protein L6164_017187 [Bauhinia variegata]|uniref:Uncharacterized protein n=1 Tax=Bauhinia variegata TaxID=167791 RepID=A0ACB9N757_BAUVA|nr:hypothetical protein L6164_017187 [Bauhinia variegata]